MVATTNLSRPWMAMALPSSSSFVVLGFPSAPKLCVAPQGHAPDYCTHPSRRSNPCTSPTPQGHCNNHSKSAAPDKSMPCRTASRRPPVPAHQATPHTTTRHTPAHTTRSDDRKPHTHTRATTGTSSTNPPWNPPSRSWPGSSPPLPLRRSCRRRRSCPCSPALAQTRQGPGSRADAGE